MGELSIRFYSYFIYTRYLYVLVNQQTKWSDCKIDHKSIYIHIKNKLIEWQDAVILSFK